MDQPSLMDGQACVEYNVGIFLIMIETVNTTLTVVLSGNDGQHDNPLVEKYETVPRLVQIDGRRMKLSTGNKDDFD